MPRAQILVVAFVLVGFLLAEIGARGSGIEPLPLPMGIATYDPGLGWVPVEGKLGAEQYHMSFKDGLRSNGRPRPIGGPVTLVIGDSFAMGSEAHDDETWPAQLEARLKAPVLNGGVGGYGLDQVVLRGEQLVARWHPDTLIVAVFSDDVNRCRFSRRERPKPYFDIEAGALVLRGVPVPREIAPPIDWLARRSAIAAVVRRSIPARPFRENPTAPPVDNLARLLVHRLAALPVRSKLIVLYDHVGDEHHLAAGVIAGALECGVQLIDLRVMAPIYFRGPGHFTPAGNRVVAATVARALRHLPAPDMTVRRLVPLELPG